MTKKYDGSFLNKSPSANNENLLYGDQTDKEKKEEQKEYEDKNLNE